METQKAYPCEKTDQKQWLKPVVYGNLKKKTFFGVISSQNINIVTKIIKLYTVLVKKCTYMQMGIKQKWIFCLHSTNRHFNTLQLKLNTYISCKTMIEYMNK